MSVKPCFFDLEEIVKFLLKYQNDVSYLKLINVKNLKEITKKKI